MRERGDQARSARWVRAAFVTRCPDPRDCGGFALIIVLWTLVLIAFIVAHITASGRTEVRIAGNLVGVPHQRSADCRIDRGRQR